MSRPRNDFFFFMPKKFLSALKEVKIDDASTSAGKIKLIAEHYVEGPRAYSELDEEMLVSLFDEEPEQQISLVPGDNKPSFIEKLMRQMGRESLLQELLNRLRSDKMKKVKRRRIM